VVLCGERPLLPEHLLPEREPGRPAVEELATLLSIHQGNLSAVARALGKDRTQVRRWLKHYQLSVISFRGQG
jgi:transcriptional regulator of acetoin/glycerol metabolism